MNYQFDYFTSWFIYICFFLINFILLTYYSIYNKKVYILLSFVFITLFTGLRFNVGRDYLSYIDMYTLFDTNDFIYRITNFDYTIIFEEIGFDLLFFIGKWSFIRRLLLNDRDSAALAAQRAELEFYRAGIGRTQNKTGILLYLALQDHEVVVLADRGISEKLSAETWGEVVEMILQGIKSKDLALGLQNAVDKCGDILASHFPVSENDRNELSNHLIILD